MAKFKHPTFDDVTVESDSVEEHVAAGWVLVEENAPVKKVQQSTVKTDNK